MKIAVTYENGQIFQHFGRTEIVSVGVASYEVRNYLPTEDEINKYIQLDIEIDND